MTKQHMHHDKPNISQANDCPPLPQGAGTIDKLVYWLGIGLGSGIPKRAPGTWGTVGGLIVAIPLIQIGFMPFVMVTIIASIVGIWICDHTSNLMMVHDDPHIVWDEWAGIWITLLPLVYLKPSLSSFYDVTSTSFIALIGAFILFRFFDIVKPFPISWADKRVKGGLGIMLDDIIAGFISAIFLSLLLMILGQ